MRRAGLRAQLVLQIGLLMVATVGLVSVVTLPLFRANMEEQARRDTERIARTVAVLLVERLDARLAIAHPVNRDAAARVARVFVRELDASRIEVVLPDGRALAILPSGERDPGDTLVARALQAGTVASRIEDAPDSVRQVVAAAPVRRGRANIIAAVRVERPLGGLQELVTETHQLSLLYVTIEACLIALLGYFLLTRSIIRPIRRLSVAAEQVAAGRLDVSVPVTQEDEIGALGRDFNQMVERIRAAQGALEERLTELQQINQSLAQAQDELVRSEKLATLGRLATGIAHEVGNPLAAVMGLVELLEDRKGLDAAEMDDLVMRVRRELTRIHEIIRNLLDYARARDKTLRTFEVIAPVRAAVGLAQHHPRARQLSIEVIEPASLLRFTGDENKLAQVVLNLLLNAADATEGRGHVRCWVDHVEEEGQPWHRVHVADDGPGIAPEVKKRLFEPFFTTKPSGRGTGLGLAVCERIAAEHGGRITVASQPGRGATFTIWLPVLRRPA